MDDLVTFLRAAWDARERELAEDERAARECGDFGRWQITGDGGVADDSGTIACGPWSGSIGEADHMIRWDPARVLREVADQRAEIDAKRRILDQYEKAFTRRKQHPDDLASAGALLALHGVAKLLALPMAKRDGYQAEWRPDDPT
jgi:hypothetical protein